MKKDLTEVVFILDKSGSMSGLESDTIGGFNAMLEKQKKTEGEALITTIEFNGTSTVIHDRLPVLDVKPMTSEDYIVGGNTALIDAIGGAVSHIETVHRYIREEDCPEKTIFIITTDGMENASHKYSSQEVKKKIEEKTEDGWEFLFLGANIDAVETAKEFGIREDHAANYNCDSKGTNLNFCAMAEAVTTVRRGKKLESSWKKSIDEDYEKRGNK